MVIKHRKKSPQNEKGSMGADNEAYHIHMKLLWEESKKNDNQNFRAEENLHSPPQAKIYHEAE